LTSLPSKLAWLPAFVLLGGAAAVAQELEPRAYSPAPIGTRFVLAGFGGSTGDILLDPAIGAENVEADLTFVTLGFGTTFAVAGRQARILAVAPYAWGEVTGEVQQLAQSQDLAGLADPRIKISLALRGAPALTREEFAHAPRRTIVGTSLTVMPPLGRYEPGQVANVGNNRWAFKPELGVSVPLGHWTFDGYAGVWLYTDNTRAYPGDACKSQDPLVSLQSHVSYSWRTGLWAALDGTWFAGGQTQVDGVESSDLQRNTRFGATVSIPVSHGHSIKLSYSSGATTRRGSDFDTLNVTWQKVWF